MIRTTTFLVLLALSLPAAAQVLRLDQEELRTFTPDNPYERLDDGRPMVPKELLDRALELSAEDCWGTLRQQRFTNQFAGDFKILQPGRKMAGRAFTALYMPQRPDLNTIVMSGLRANGYPSGGHQYAIDSLREDDVLVVDAWGGLTGFVGDNLATYIEVAAKKNGGLVVDGGIRDLEGMAGIDTQIYYRFADPGAVTNFTLVGINIPVRVGEATVMPGDVVVGDREGVTFVPPHLIEEILADKLETVIHDDWTKEKLRTGQYKSHEIYGRPRAPELIAEYQEYRKKRYAELGMEPPER